MDWSNPTVQGATIAVVGVLIAAFAGFAGAILGAWIAARAQRSAAALAQTEAQADRLEVRKARLDERTVSLASTALVASERHKKEVGVQMRAWGRAAARGLNPDGVIPDVHRADDVLDAVGGLYMVASQETADAGSRLYNALLLGLDPLVYNAEEHRQGDTVTAPDYGVLTVRSLRTTPARSSSSTPCASNSGARRWRRQRSRSRTATARTSRTRRRTTPDGARRHPARGRSAAGADWASKGGTAPLSRQPVRADGAGRWVA